MATFNFIHFLTITILIAIVTTITITAIVTTTATTTVVTTTVTAAIKGAYWFEQEIFPASAINSSFFTHIFYAFLIPNYTTYTLQISNSESKSLSKFINSLRTKNPPLKTLISIGGGGSNSNLFAKIVTTRAARAAFIKSTIFVAHRFGFDGVDLDWEFPKTGEQMSNLGILLREWRFAIAADSKISGKPPLLLTAAVYFADNFFLSATQRQYPVASINNNLDFINIMSYDFYGSWNNNTGAPAVLFDPKSNINIVSGIISWIQAGLDPKKMVMGLPLYGRKWMLRDPNVNSLGAPAIGVIGINGTKGFVQIEEFNKEMNAKVVYDMDTVSVYSYSNTSWIGYDDPLTVTVKVGFAQALGLRGYFFWAVGYDNDIITRQASKAWILYERD
ncbi:hypothetical protein Lal_00026412 [Lupinus albus]|uniref:Putative glycoside hydrolase superfamily, chitinase insertion domain-containing protein n=1 Tax=Lupinus albus TaxID=3870 RepID=A0A6A5MDY7_LUPAL|nr:putative glycoside hydrolase superfamily, chitinase insertion domain-containing protein [Lupinus albus]KAF1870718.1 hypothetical protein Lal_00026412 [Lupinus albus]